MATITPEEPAYSPISNKNINFRWIYIVLPAAILLLSIVLAALFYRRLPPEVAYHFTGGAPDRWINRGALIAWMIVPQFVLLFAGAAISGGISILSRRFFPSENTPVSKVLAIMGNMVAMPQVILAFAMLDIFLYNAYRIHLLPLWIFVLVVMVIGGVILGTGLIQAFRQFRGNHGKSP